MFPPPEELIFECMHAAGPGGQGVNTANSAVQLRFDVMNSQALTPEVKARLLRLAGRRRVNAAGEIVLTAMEFRSQQRNRAAALSRLAELLEQAESPPKPRRATSVPRSEKRRRRNAKARASEIKRNRKSPIDE